MSNSKIFYLVAVASLVLIGLATQANSQALEEPWPKWLTLIKNSLSECEERLFDSLVVFEVLSAPLQAAIPVKGPPVTDICLGCICEAISGCNQTKACNGDVCGLFRITWAYWADGGKLTLNGESSQSQTAFQNCVNDPYCAANTIQNYMQKFGQDCNGDGQIDCYDYAAIHKLGGYGCQAGLTGTYATKLNQCLAAFSPSG